MLQRFRIALAHKRHIKKQMLKTKAAEAEIFRLLNVRGSCAMVVKVAALGLLGHRCPSLHVHGLEQIPNL